MSKYPNFKPHLALLAAAGSGKTFALSARYISLLFMGESPAAILAATFTNKAAAEMRERVIKSLRNLGSDRAFLEAISQQTGMTPHKLLEKGPEVLRRFLASPAYIVTLDSFFVSILRSASLELGLEPDFVTKEESEEKLEMLFLEEVHTDGKLGMLVRLAMDIEDKRFARIFALMQDFYKIDPLLPPSEYPLPDMNRIEREIEACRQKVHRLVVEAKASPSAIRNFEAADIKTLASRPLFEKVSLTEHRHYKKYVLANPQIDEAFLALKAHLAEWMEAKERIVLHHLFALYDHYKNAKISHAKLSGVLTFDDLVYFTYRLLYEGISKEFLYFKLDAKFKHILLDEFQDTSTLQFLLLKPMIDEIFAGEGQGGLRSFFYVGDTKQSLYRFRGGVEALFDMIAKQYGIDVDQMDTNYRSSRHVVAQVNRWFEGKMPGFLPQKPKPDAIEGYVEVVEVAEAEDLTDEAVAAVKTLLERGVPVDDIALLVTTNKDGQSIQEACEAAGIPTLLKTSSSLKYLPKIAALVAMVSYLYGGEKIDAQAILECTQKRLDSVDFGWFSPAMAPLQVIDRLVKIFDYFEGDRNLLKLMAFAANFKHIPDFLEEFATSSIPVAQGSVHGVRIMTIHGSKGLEFGHVIVADKMSRPSNDTAPLLYRYNEALRVERILYRMKGREHLDRYYAQVIEERKESVHKDRLNVLYVALTRAATGMTVLKKEKGSLFDPLEMVPLMLGRKEPAEKREECTEVPAVSKRVALSYYGMQEKAKRESEEEVDHQAVLFGTALHYTLEMMAGFEKESLSSALSAMKSRYGLLLSKEEIADIAQRIERLLEHTPFMRLLEGASFYKERSLSYQNELKQIDLLLEYPQECMVVDYKSSQKGFLKHQAQVSSYVKAVQALTGKATKGAILYLEKEKIELKFLK